MFDALQHQNGILSIDFTSLSLLELGECFPEMILFYFAHSSSSIIGSLAGTSYYGPVAGHGLLSHDLELLREQRKDLLSIAKHVVPGDIEVVPAGETATHYVRIHKKERQDDGGKEEI